MTTPATAAAKVFTNKWTWIIIVVLIIAFVLYKNGNRWLAQIQRRDRGHYDGQEAVTANPVRQGQLEEMARDAYTVLNSTLFLSGVTATGREETLAKLLTLNDTELRYVATFYKGLTDGNTLKYDIGEVRMPFSSVDQQLESKLTQLNL